jgi:hypothetical protein
MGILAKLILGGKWLAGMIGRGLAWLFEKPVRLLIAGLAIALAWQVLVTAPGVRAERDDALALAAERKIEAFNERQAHRQTKMDYRAAQAEAATLEAARLARVTAEQQEISDDVVQAYRARLADARLRAGGLRRSADTPARERAAGATGGEPVPGAGDAAGRADQATGDRGLPAGDADDLDWRLTATEQAIQLDALIDWVLRQGAIDPNAAPGR